MLFNILFSSVETPSPFDKKVNLDKVKKKSEDSLFNEKIDFSVMRGEKKR